VEEVVDKDVDLEEEMSSTSVVLLPLMTTPKWAAILLMIVRLELLQSKTPRSPIPLYAVPPSSLLQLPLHLPLPPPSDQELKQFETRNY